MIYKFNFKEKSGKYAERIGKAAHSNDNMVYNEAFPWLDEAKVNEIILKPAGTPKRNLTEKLGNAVTDDLKVYFSGTPVVASILNAPVVGNTFQLLRNIPHKRRVKSSVFRVGGIVGAAAAGAAAGGVAGALAGTAIPGLGNFLGMLGGAVVGGGVVLGGSILAATIAQKPVESLSKTLFPGEYKYELSKKTARDIKRTFGIPSHVAQLMQGYLYNRMSMVEDQDIKDDLSIFIKIGLEAQDGEILKAMLTYFSEELDEAKKSYLDKKTAYDMYKEKSSNKQSDEYVTALESMKEEMDALKEDYQAVQYILEQTSKAKIEGKQIITFPKNILDKLNEKLPNVATKAQGRVDDLWSKGRELSREMRQTGELKKSVISPLGVSSKPLFQTQPKTINVNVPTVTPLEGETLMAYCQTLAQRNPPITFMQAQKEDKVESHFSMSMEKVENEMEIKRAMHGMMQEIEVLLRSTSIEDRANFAMEIEADKGLDPEKRISSAMHLCMGAKRLGIQFELVNYSKDEQEAINERLIELVKSSKDILETKNVRATLKPTPPIGGGKTH